MNDGRTVHGRNQVSGWENVRNFLKRSAQKIFFHERIWDVALELCSETGPLKASWMLVTTPE